MSHKSMTKYTLDCPADEWDAWKVTVPRDKRLGDRLVELLKADRRCHADHGEGLVERLETLEVDDG